MKKVLLATLALMGTYGISKAANVLTVNNLTACSYTLSLAGGGIVTVGPGVTTFNSYPATNITEAKVVYIVGGGATNVGFGVGMSNPYANSLGQPTPPCLTSSTFFTGSWAQSAATANATLIIF
ncbi:hypothetical protein DBR32_10090 [Taibaiella sp. KBW10]|uniref:hypothetical protein n=1 Tax=Taibaiella sp. KBW10 TaxID=2153357 RepID=UPI000F5AC79A|nr:hypothetical protein [Taibaiella sp. KBW10]RQO31047.1 hypothetical protein DBR32_10090 [Taibaiella sp. KBW10]